MRLADTYSMGRRNRVLLISGCIGAAVGLLAAFPSFLDAVCTDPGPCRFGTSLLSTVHPGSTGWPFAAESAVVFGVVFAAAAKVILAAIRRSASAVLCVAAVTAVCGIAGGWYGSIWYSTGFGGFVDCDPWVIPGGGSCVSGGIWTNRFGHTFLTQPVPAEGAVLFGVAAALAGALLSSALILLASRYRHERTERLVASSASET
jgi:hypothetical protein